MPLRLQVLAALLVALVVNAMVFGGVSLTLARFARVFVSRAAFGAGKTMRVHYLGATRLEWRLLPTNAWVEFYGATSRNDESDDGAALPTGRRRWTDAPVWRRVLAFVIAPRLSVLLLASALLGPTRTLHGLTLGVTAFVQGVLSPLTAAPGTLDRAVILVTTEGACALTMLALCKITSAGLFTLPADFAFACLRRTSLGVERFRMLTHVAIQAAMLAWVVACCSWLLR